MKTMLMQNFEVTNKEHYVCREYIYVHLWYVMVFCLVVKTRSRGPRIAHFTVVGLVS